MTCYLTSYNKKNHGQESEDSDFVKQKDNKKKGKAKHKPSKVDISRSEHCDQIIANVIAGFGQLDILVNHAGEQYQTNTLDDVTGQVIHVNGGLAVNS